ncbi:GNAT family acetyltransferase [candidate division WOR-3 bacterium]|nr:GNAT family acetyltransferase [candidate division WOR-3 bacterium]
MLIRPYQDKDSETVAALWRVVFPDDPPWNVPEEDIERKLKIQPELFFVAEDGGEIVGTTMGGYDGHRGWVYLVAVLPDYRRKGVGKVLMDAVECGLKKIGCPKLNLQVRGSNKEVVEFYKKLGYVTEDRVSMSKRLK